MIKINSISIINQKNRDSQPVFGYFVSFLYESVPTLSKVAIDLFKIIIQCRLVKKYECCVRHAAWRTAMVRVPTNHTLTKRHWIMILNLTIIITDRSPYLRTTNRASK